MMKANNISLSPEEQTARMSSERAVLTQLLQAAVSGDFATIQRVTNTYLQEHPQLTVAQVLTQFRDAQKRTVLHFACQSKATHTPTPTSTSTATATATITPSTTTDDIVPLLLNWLPPAAVAKALRCKDSEGLTPLMMAAQCFDTATAELRIKAILQADAAAAAAAMPTSDSNNNNNTNTNNNSNKLGLMRSKAGATALHYAAANGLPSASIAALYQAGTLALDAFSLRGGTPLHWACAVPPPANHSTSIQALLELGADINASTTALRTTTETTTTPIDHSAPSNTIIPPPLALAMAAGNDIHAKCILQSGRNVESSVHFVLQPGNATMFHMAADMNLTGVLSLLIEQYTRSVHHNDLAIALGQRNSDENVTALDLAAKQKHMGCVLVLLDAMGLGSTEENATDYVEQWNVDNNQSGNRDATATIDEQNANVVDNKSSEDPVEAKAKREAAALQQHVLASNNSADISGDSQELAQQHKTSGNDLYAQKEWTQAAVEYSAAITADPLNATYYSNRSACYMALHQLELALHDAVMARCLRPEWPKAAYRMAVARLALERYEDAAVAAWEGLQLDSENEELKSLLQKCVKKGRKDFHESKAIDTRL